MNTASVGHDPGCRNAEGAHRRRGSDDGGDVSLRAPPPIISESQLREAVAALADTLEVAGPW
jgi:hypothetical protein